MAYDFFPHETEFTVLSLRHGDKGDTLEVTIDFGPGPTTHMVSLPINSLTADTIYAAWSNAAPDDVVKGRMVLHLEVG